jgi:cytoskeletal protein CcmA (bactofilin family)
MFGSSKSSDDKKSGSVLPSSVAHSLNSLVKGTLLEGNIKTESDIRVDGTMKGHLSCQAKVIIGPSGIIEGEIRCQNAVIEGRFDGKLWVTDTLTVKETAEITGNVQTNKLNVQPGAVFNVSCKMDELIGSNGQTKLNPQNLAKPAVVNTPALAGAKV